MALVKKENLFPLGPFRREMDRLFDEFMGEKWPSIFEPGVLTPAVEVGETSEEVFVNVQVPGLAKEDLDVELTEHALTVRGEVREEKEDKKKNYHRQEFRTGRFSRTITLPGEVEIDKAKADLEKGMLKVHIPKTEKAKKRAITVPIH